MMKRYVSFLVAAVVALSLVGCDRSGPAVVGPDSPKIEAVPLSPVAGEMDPLDPPTSSARVIMRKNGITMEGWSKKRAPRYGCRVSNAYLGEFAIRLTFARRHRKGSQGHISQFIYRFDTVPNRKAAKKWRPKKKPRRAVSVVRCWVPKTAEAMQDVRKLVKAALHKVHGDRVWIFKPGHRPGRSHYMMEGDDIAGCPESHERSDGTCGMDGVTIGAPRYNPPPPIIVVDTPPAPMSPGPQGEVMRGAVVVGRPVPVMTVALPRARADSRTAS